MYYLTFIGIAFLLALLLVFIVKSIAVRNGLLAYPQKDRWHEQPTALHGGIGIFLAFLIPLLTIIQPHSQQGLLIIGISSVLFVIGLMDDIHTLHPFWKLGMQILAGILLFQSGLLFHFTPWGPVNFVLTLFWFVGITNAFNLLDNIDGLSAGIAAIVSLVLAALLYESGNSHFALILLIFTGAVAGFLVYNVKPASIFMGDSGSLFIGSFLAGSALLYPQLHTGDYAVSCVILVFIFIIPICDTTFVTTVRLLSQRPIYVGGRDHLSHRLVSLGFSDQQAVAALFFLSIITGGIAYQMSITANTIVFITAFLTGLALLGTGIFLARDWFGRELQLAQHAEERKTLIIGTLELCEMLLKQPLRSNGSVFCPVGILAPSDDHTQETVNGYPILGTDNDFQKIATVFKVTDLIVSQEYDIISRHHINTICSELDIIIHYCDQQGKVSHSNAEYV